jgi:WhiB family redox-sensing transcriptional regulator
MSTLNQLLLALAGAPALPGARCRNRGALFDPPAPREAPATFAARHRQAIGLCAGCPALSACQTWFIGLPKRQRPQGVVAGRVRGVGREVSA